MCGKKKKQNKKRIIPYWQTFKCALNSSCRKAVTCTQTCVWLPGWCSQQAPVTLWDGVLGGGDKVKQDSHILHIAVALPLLSTVQNPPPPHIHFQKSQPVLHQSDLSDEIMKQFVSVSRSSLHFSSIVHSSFNLYSSSGNMCFLFSFPPQTDKSNQNQLFHLSSANLQ